MSFNVEFKSGDIKRQLDAAIKEGMDKLAREHTQLLDWLGRRLRGRPVTEIKPVLKREWRRINGGDISDPELSQIAQAISDGTRVEFRNGGIK